MQNFASLRGNDKQTMSKPKTNLIKLTLLAVFLSEVVFGWAESSFAASKPVILYTDIISGPNQGTNDGPGGAYLSIFGRNFGDNISDIRVTIGGGEVGAYKHLGPSLGRPDIQWLGVQLGSNCRTGPIVVSVNGEQSNTDQIFTVRSGNIYFVSLSGNDSTGVVNDITKPYRTPNKFRTFSTACNAGDFIVVRGGVYDLDDGTNNIYSNTWFRPVDKSGTLGNPITFMGYPGEKVNAKMDTMYKIFSPYGDAHDFVVANFYSDINNCQPGNLIGVGSSAASSICLSDPDASDTTIYNVRIVNIEADGKGTGGMCAGISGSNMIEIGYTNNSNVLGCSVHDMGIPANGEVHSHVIYLATTQRNTEVGWNALYNIPYSRAVIQVHQDGFGGSCKGQKFLSDILVHDNVIHDVRGQPILLGGGAGDIWVYNNLVYNSHNGPAVYSDILAIRGENVDGRIFNNTFYANPDYDEPGIIISFGFGSSDHPIHVALYNNIFVVTETQDAYFEITDSSWNNITSNNNLWFGSSQGLPSFAGQNELNSNPFFVNPLAGVFHLQSGSPAIDSGSSLVSSIVNKDFLGLSRPQGSGYDIGAFEYNENTPADTAAPAAPRGLRVR